LRGEAFGCIIDNSEPHIDGLRTPIYYTPEEFCDKPIGQIILLLRQRQVMERPSYQPIKLDCAI
jgi:hypothetical protein